MRLPIDSQFIQSRMKYLSLTHRVLLERGLNRTTTDAISKGDSLHIDAIFRLAKELLVNAVKLIDPQYPDMRDNFRCHVTDSLTSWDKYESVLIGPSTSEELKASYIESHRQYMNMDLMSDLDLASESGVGEDKILQMRAEIDLLNQATFDSPVYEELLAPKIGWLSSLVPEEVILGSRDQLLALEEGLVKSLVDFEPLSNQVQTLDMMLKKAERNSEKANIQRRSLDIESKDFNLLHFRKDRTTTISEQIFEPIQVGENAYDLYCSRYNFLIKPLVTTHLLILVPKTESVCFANVAREARRENILNFHDLEDNDKDALVPLNFRELYPESWETWTETV
jgi:hypothetical protein